MDIGDDSLPGWVFKMSLAGEHASRLVQEPEEHQGERHDPEDEELGPQGKQASGRVLVAARASA